MKLKSFHWTRRTVVYALIGLAVLLALAVIWRSNGGVLSAHYNVTTTDGRIAYLQALGWEADPATETAQEIVIPRVFNGVFGDYNALQKQQGFDLSTYAGETCTAYTYRVTNYEGSTDTVLAQLFVYRNRVIGGNHQKLVPSQILVHCPQNQEKDTVLHGIIFPAEQYLFSCFFSVTARFHLLPQDPCQTDA